MDKSRRCLLVVCTLFVLSLLPVSPAAANLAESGLVIGTMRYGTAFDRPCTDQGDAQATGKGLYLPFMNDHSGTWSLTVTVISFPSAVGQLRLCGTTAPDLAGFGPHCFGHTGSGTGKMVWTGKPGLSQVLTVSILVQGGFLRLSGTASERHGASKLATGVTKAFHLQAVRAPAEPCDESKPEDGLTQATVSGNFVMG